MQRRGSLAKQVDGPAHCSPLADQLRGRVTLDGSQRTRSIVQFPLAELVENAVAFCRLPQYESVPLSIIEAMRAGLPVVATDIGGVSELVTDGVTGHLVPSSDVLLLRKRMQELITSPERRAGGAFRVSERVVHRDGDFSFGVIVLNGRQTSVVS